jgi:hypothetical protein
MMRSSRAATVLCAAAVLLLLSGTADAKTRNFTKKERKYVKQAIQIIRVFGQASGLAPYADNLDKMLGTELKNADGSNRGLKQVHAETARGWKPKGSTTPYRPPGGKLTGSIRINDDLLKPHRIAELAGTLLHEKVHAVRLEKEGNEKAWKLDAIYITVNKYIKDSGGDKDEAKRKIQEAIDAEEAKPNPDQKRIKHLKKAKELVDGGPYTCWIEVEAYYTQLKLLLILLAEGYPGVDEELIGRVISNLRLHEMGTPAGQRLEDTFRAIDAGGGTPTQKTQQKIAFIDGVLAGIQTKIDQMETTAKGLIGDPITQTIDSTGGTIQLFLPNNTTSVPDFEMTIPPGALSVPVTFTIDELTEALPAAWVWEHTPASPSFYISPEGLLFASRKAPTLTIRYFSGYSPEGLDIHRAPNTKPNDGRWDRIATRRTVDTANETITATTTELSAFAVMGDDPLVRPYLPAEVKVSPSTLSLDGEGEWVTVRIRLPEGHHPEDIDPTTVELHEIDGAALAQPMTVAGGRVQYGEGDRSSSGLMVKLHRQQLILLLGAGSAELGFRGELADGTRFGGSDTIRVID